MIQLLDTIRFTHLSSTFMTQAVETSPFFEAIKKTESYQNATAKSGTKSWSRSARQRGKNLEVRKNKLLKNKKRVEKKMGVMGLIASIGFGHFQMFLSEKK